jgi:MoaA/NifB/PqqE/SkfB family radical SAM enzyme
MRRLGVMTTYRCNLACAYCFNETHEGVASGYDADAEREQDADGVDACVGALRERGYSGVTVTGGEPFLCPATWHWLEATGRHGLEAIVITNGTGMSRTMIDRLHAHPALKLSVSIGGADAEHHDADRGQWRRTRRTLDRLRDAGLRFELSFVITARNATSLPEVADLAELLGVEAHLAPVSLGADATALAALSLRRLTAADWDDVATRCGSPTLRAELAIVRSFLRGTMVVSRCGMRTQSQVLDPYGDVYGCFFRRDLHLGNVFDEPLGAILDRVDGDTILPAPCFGDHCLTMQYH